MIWPLFSPVMELRKYYGSEIAFYFVWMIQRVLRVLTVYRCNCANMAARWPLQRPASNQPIDLGEGRGGKREEDGGARRSSASAS